MPRTKVARDVLGQIQEYMLRARLLTTKKFLFTYVGKNMEEKLTEAAHPGGGFVAHCNACTDSKFYNFIQFMERDREILQHDI